MLGKEWIEHFGKLTSKELSEIADALVKIEEQKDRLYKIDETIVKEFSHLNYINQLDYFIREEQRKRTEKIKLALEAKNTQAREAQKHRNV